MKKKHKRLLTILTAAVLLNIVMNISGNWLEVGRYSLASEKLTQPVRIVFISDLHNCTYGGEEQTKLWEIMQEEQPDLVLFGGDVIDMVGGMEHALKLMEMTQEVYPCAYTSGNHELENRNTEAFLEEVEARNVPILHGDYLDVTLNGQAIRISGFIHAGDYPEQLAACAQTAEEERYNILLAHQPEQFDAILDACMGEGTSMDLVLSGHSHGGQWRIPGILEQGLFSPDQGIFPEFTCGQREENGTVQIVSRGLAKPLRMILIPRICNRPELSVIEILPE